MVRPARRLAALILGLAALSTGARAAEPVAPWAPSRTTSPESVSELKALQARVKDVVAKVTPSVVGLIVGASHRVAAGSGVIVHEDGTVLTAAHVIVSPYTHQPYPNVIVILADGQRVAGRSLGVNMNSDTGMIKITGRPPANADWPGAANGKWPAIPLRATEIEPGQWVVALGHPGGFKVDRRPPVRVGRYDRTVRESLLSEPSPYLRTDCVLVGGDSGGPLFDLRGKLLGIHSQIRESLSSNLHVPVSVFEAEWKSLAAGKALPAMRVSLGVGLDEDADMAVVVEVVAGGAAERAGVKPGDVITSLNSVPVRTPDDLMFALFSCSPGDRVPLGVARERPNSSKPRIVELEMSFPRKKSASP